MTDNFEEVRKRFDGAEDISAPQSTPHPKADEGPVEAEAARLPLNDLGNGKRFALYYGADALHVPRVGWHIWDGLRWEHDDDAVRVRLLAHKVPDRIAGEIEHLGFEDWEEQALASEEVHRARSKALNAIDVKERTDDQRAELIAANKALDTIENIKSRLRGRKKAHKDYSKSTGNSGKLTNMLAEAEALRWCDLNALDAAPLDVNTASGVLRFAVSGEGAGRVGSFDLCPHDRRDYITKLMPVDYDPRAKCEQFDRFIERVQPNVEIRAFIQRFLGLAMTSLACQKLLFLYGSGANGKSVLVDLMARIFGDYSATAKIESLTGNKKRGGGDATPDLVPLMGARFVRSSEPEEGERMREAEIKALTGGEPILIRALNKDFVEVTPVFKLMISGNHKPEIRGTDDGIWRRVALVPFDVQIPPEERDPLLGEKLWKERSGVLNWLIAGLLDYLENGLCEPAVVTAATQEYREDSDPLGTFLTEACEVTGDASDFILSRDLVQAFNTWLEMRGETTWGSRTVSKRLKTAEGRWRHPKSNKTFGAGKRTATGKTGIKLTAEFENDARAFRSEHGSRGGYDRPSAPPDAAPAYIPDPKDF